MTEKIICVDKTGWANAFTTIQEAWDSLPAVVEDDIVIKIRANATPYRELVTVSKKLVLGSVTFEGEHYVYGDVEANVGGVGEITDVGAFGNVEVGDKVFVIDLNGADGRNQNYQYGVVDDVSNKPDRIGTTLTVTPTTNWKYTIVRTEVSGSDDGTPGGIVRAQTFYLQSVQNVTLRGLFLTLTSVHGVYAGDSRGIKIYGSILKDTYSGVGIIYLSEMEIRYSMIDSTYHGFLASRVSHGAFYYGGISTIQRGAISPLDGSFIAVNWAYLTNAASGVQLEASHATINKTTISNTVILGISGKTGSGALLNYTTNNAVTPFNPIVGTDRSESMAWVANP